MLCCSVQGHGSGLEIPMLQKLDIIVEPGVTIPQNVTEPIATTQNVIVPEDIVVIVIIAVIILSVVIVVVVITSAVEASPTVLTVATNIR